MKDTYFDSRTFGIGQLLNQRKRFIVPKYQRDFSWDIEDSDLLFTDILDAYEQGATDYFIGLIALLGPTDQHYFILDGQQRLVTTSAIFAGLRNWLLSHNFQDDSIQIENDFITVRSLGGDLQPRLTLNDTNRDCYNSCIVNSISLDDLSLYIKTASRNSSNYKLSSATRSIFQLIDDFATSCGENDNDRIRSLFKFSLFLENHVRAVVFDVSSEANAYMIFEATNARGNELSQLDLVKNYIFGQSIDSTIESVEYNWHEMALNIEDKRADDFLKVFWTSQFGRIQKARLYQNIKQKYHGSKGTNELSIKLNNISILFSAIDDPNNEIWPSIHPSCSSLIATLNLLGNRQVRAPIIAALDNGNIDIKDLLLSLITLTLRYQTVGKRRTGALEIECARASKLISDNKINSINAFVDEIKHIIPSDDEFIADFIYYSDTKRARISYILFMLEMTSRVVFKDHEYKDINIPFGIFPDYIDHIVSKKILLSTYPEDTTIIDTLYSRIGNCCMLEPEIYSNLNNRMSLTNKNDKVYKKSNYILTNNLKTLKDQNIISLITERQKDLAKIAVKAWPIREF